MATVAPRRSAGLASTQVTRLDDLRAEHHELIHSMEFAFAMGHSQTLGKDPRLDWVLRRVDELRREIAELSAEEQR
jgi:hypothetical protein